MTKLPSPFDNPTTYPGHSGIDFPQKFDTLIKASGPGVVTKTGWQNDRAGYVTFIKYDDLVEVGYCHEPNYYPVKKGDRVVEGSHIGYIGSSGHSDGPHLHLEILTGPYAGTDYGVWEYFDKNKVVGQGSVAGEESPITQKEEIAMNGMLYFITKNDKKDGVPQEFALAGTGNGEAAWLAITDQNVANHIAANTLSKGAIWLTKSTYNTWRDKYLGIK